MSDTQSSISSSQSITGDTSISPRQKDKNLEEQSSSSSLSSSPTNESQGLFLLRQALNMSSTTEITMPDGTKVEVFSQPKRVNEVSEFVQILSEDRRNLTPKEQADIRASIVKKQHLPTFFSIILCDQSGVAHHCQNDQSICRCNVSSIRFGSGQILTPTGVALGWEGDRWAIQLCLDLYPPHII
jgi:hypothetical protein